ncbi:hypothetical protein [Bradyrhizobium sp. NAS96.2]|uniref:hypothetical protein n=1 Tax=Bradyrhizobium sp. NAS96.2 TaxID=1680160 RepID=UPI0011610FF1|nr:hypothetical protein [Bradyrhizobium sp. NAS96.2]
MAITIGLAGDLKSLEATFSRAVTPAGTWRFDTYRAGPLTARFDELSKAVAIICAGDVAPERRRSSRAWRVPSKVWAGNGMVPDLSPPSSRSSKARFPDRAPAVLTDAGQPKIKVSGRMAPMKGI